MTYHLWRRMWKVKWMLLWLKVSYTNILYLAMEANILHLAMEAVVAVTGEVHEL